ncbi:MAG: hypothetical protein LBR85_04315 [Oscillospiraceae bacterium]|jgi:hypothetical protein|nr:hypothetical protein [Oscillospiraceae bacterium]
MEYLRNAKSRCSPQEEHIISSENKIVHNAYNCDKNHVRQYKLDGDIFPPNTQPIRCDFLVINDDKNAAYFIELSSYKKIKHAIDQLQQSYRMLQPELHGATCYFCLVLNTATTKATLRGKRLRDWKAGGHKRKFGSSPMNDCI